MTAPKEPTLPTTREETKSLSRLSETSPPTSGRNHPRLLPGLSPAPAAQRRARDPRTPTANGSDIVAMGLAYGVGGIGAFLNVAGACTWPTGSSQAPADVLADASQTCSSPAAARPSTSAPFSSPSPPTSGPTSASPSALDCPSSVPPGMFPPPPPFPNHPDASPPPSASRLPLTSRPGASSSPGPRSSAQASRPLASGQRTSSPSSSAKSSPSTASSCPSSSPRTPT